MQTQCNFNNILWSFVFFPLSTCFKRHLVSADVYNRCRFSVSPDAVGPQRLNCHHVLSGVCCPLQSGRAGENAIDAIKESYNASFL